MVNKLAKQNKNNKRIFGIEIAENNLKFVELFKKDNQLRLGKFGEQIIPEGVLNQDEIKYPNKLQEIIFSLRKKLKIKVANFSLPFLKNDEIIDNKIFDIFKKLNFESFNLIEPQQAMTNCFKKNDDQNIYLAVDFGQEKINIFIFEKNIIISKASLPFGSDHINEIIAKEFSLNKEDAEKIKNLSGLIPKEQNKKINKLITNFAQIIAEKIDQQYINFYTLKKTNIKIKKIILCGGGANLMGLADYLEKKLKIKVSLANVWENIYSFEEEIPEINFANSLRYATAIGLALENFVRNK